MQELSAPVHEKVFLGVELDPVSAQLVGDPLFARLHALSSTSLRSPRSRFVLVALVATNATRVKLDWILSSTRVSMVWIIVAAAVLGCLAQDRDERDLPLAHASPRTS